jgi:hypothetical protein
MAARLAPAYPEQHEEMLVKIRHALASADTATAGTALKTLSRLSITTAALVLMGAGSVAVAAGASAATSSSGSEASVSARIKGAAAARDFHRIRNAAFSECIDAPGGRLNVVLKLASCSDAPRTRKWAFVPTGAPNTFFVVNEASGLCMEVNDGTSTPGERVDEFTCNGLSSEQWVVEELTLRHAGTDQCLDTVGGRGSELMQFTCGQAFPAGAQAWIIE